RRGRSARVPARPPRRPRPAVRGPEPPATRRSRARRPAPRGVHAAEPRARPWPRPRRARGRTGRPGPRSRRSRSRPCRRSGTVPAGRGRSRSLLPDRLLATLPFLLAQHVLLDLAGRGAGQLAELDLGRALELGQVLAAEGDQVV